MKTVLSKGGYEDYSIKRLLLTLNWLIKPSFTMFLSINTEFRVDWKRKRVSEIEWHILTLPIMMPQPKAIMITVFYHTTFYFSLINSTQTLSKYTFWSPYALLKICWEKGEFSKFSQKACMDSLSFRSISIQAKRSISKIIYLGDKSLKEALYMIVNFKLKLYMQINVLLTGKIWGYGKNMKVRWIGAFSWYVPSFIRSK